MSEYEYILSYFENSAREDILSDLVLLALEKNNNNVIHKAIRNGWNPKRISNQLLATKHMILNNNYEMINFRLTSFDSDSDLDSNLKEDIIITSLLHDNSQMFKYIIDLLSLNVDNYRYYIRLYKSTECAKFLTSYKIKIKKAILKSKLKEIF